MELSTAINSTHGDINYGVILAAMQGDEDEWDGEIGDDGFRWFDEEPELVARGYPTCFAVSPSYFGEGEANFFTSGVDTAGELTPVTLPEWANREHPETMLGAACVVPFLSELEPNKLHSHHSHFYEFKRYAGEIRATARPSGPPEPGKPTCIKATYEIAEEECKEEIKEAFCQLEAAAPGTFSAVDKLWHPPRGAAIEKDRLAYYFARAANTRFDSFGFEKTPKGPQYALFKYALSTLFKRRGDFHLPHIYQLCDVEVSEFGVHHYSVKSEVFERILSDCKPTGMPGYPYVYIANQVQEIDPRILHRDLNDLVNLWLSYDFNSVMALPEPQRTLKLFADGVVMPATVFIKGEPTKRDKVARNIYGVSILMNLMSRLLFGDFVRSLTDTWHVAEHKVGIDFYTEEGLNKIRDFHISLFKNATSHARIVYSDDVQGWEYNVRGWMHDAWHQAFVLHALGLPSEPGRDFLRESNLGPRFVCIMQLHNAFRIATKHVPMMFSDGTISVTPFYHRQSGEFLTHIKNSDERAALAMLAAVLPGDDARELFRFPICETNGDDCVAFEGNVGLYSELGFVVTDRTIQSPYRVNFCSQIFEMDQQGSMIRMPEGLSKLFVNACTSTNDQDYFDCLHNVVMHPAFYAFRRAVDSIRSVRKARLLARPPG